MSAPPFYALNHATAPRRQPQPGEPLVEFYVEWDHARWLCELRDHGDTYGIEAQFWRNEEFIYSRRFDARVDPTRAPRELGIAWAEEERKAIESGEA